MQNSKDKQGRDTHPRDKKSPPRYWESSIDRQIREAMERGDFQYLPGQGKPLDLTPDPHTPPAWDLAFKLLKDAGFAPEWIEQDKEIRAAKANVLRPLQSYLSRQGEVQSDGASSEARLIADFCKHAAELNRMIDDFNLKAPSPRLHHARLRVEVELEKFRTAIAKGRG
jgi:DnaJ homolog subfamily C member 28